MRILYSIFTPKYFQWRTTFVGMKGFKRPVKVIWCNVVHNEFQINKNKNETKPKQSNLSPSLCERQTKIVSRCNKPISICHPCQDI